MNRRDILRGLSATCGAAFSQSSAARDLRGTAPPDWQLLDAHLSSRLINVRSPLANCVESKGAGADALFARLKNPYYLGDEPGLTQTLGWVDAWTSRASEYAVAAETAADVSRAINFARTNRVPLVVKGGGHSYFGNSNRAGSLLIWTKRMQAITLHDDFVGAACPPNSVPVPAVSIGAGAIWGQVYDAVSVKAGRYVQGGGCLTVGVAGFVQGGGFGSLSKQFGTGAANLLEAEVVTADGKARLANAVQEPELLSALKGGGGGTFGVVTRLTLRTHPLPQTIGAILLSIQANSDVAWRTLVARMIAFYAQALFNPAWGEQIRFAPDRTLSVSMVFHGVDEARARDIWRPFLDWISARPQDYQFTDGPLFLVAPARRFWDPTFLKTLPGVVLSDDRAGAPASNVFWATNLGEAGQVLNAYQSAWLSQKWLRPAAQDKLIDALVLGSSRWSMALHTNKGLAGGSREALELTGQTSTNPAVLDAFALLICAADAPPAWPGIPGHEPDIAKGRHEANRVREAMAPIRQLAPDAGAYVSEADYFGDRWQSRYWGSNYRQLLATKSKYDPNGLFSGRHTVGSVV